MTGQERQRNDSENEKRGVAENCRPARDRAVLLFFCDAVMRRPVPGTSAARDNFAAPTPRVSVT